MLVSHLFPFMRFICGFFFSFEYIKAFYHLVDGVANSTSLLKVADGVRGLLWFSQYWHTPYCAYGLVLSKHVEILLIICEVDKAYQRITEIYLESLRSSLSCLLSLLKYCSTMNKEFTSNPSTRLDKDYWMSYFGAQEKVISQILGTSQSLNLHKNNLMKS